MYSRQLGDVTGGNDLPDHISPWISIASLPMSVRWVGPCPQQYLLGGTAPWQYHEPITEVWGQAPSGLQGQSPWSEDQEAKPDWSWNTFGFWTFNRSRKFAHFSKIWKRTKIRYLCYLCPKNQMVTKLGDGAKLVGLCSPLDPGLKPPQWGSPALAAVAAGGTM